MYINANGVEQFQTAGLLIEVALYGVQKYSFDPCII